MLTIERRRGKKIINEQEYLFPTYLLIKMELSTDNWHAINNTRGIIRLLSAESKRPQPLRRGEVEGLMDAEQAGQLKRSEIVHFRSGDRVRVKHGPLVDQIATCLTTRNERVSCLLNVLGGSVRVTIPRQQLQLVARPTF